MKCKQGDLAVIKYSVNPKINLIVEVAQRFTTTDYLDDVSTTFAPRSLFPNDANGDPSIALLLQDRSYEIDPNNMLSNVPGIGIKTAKLILLNFQDLNYLRYS